MPTCKTAEAEIERREKISKALKGISKGPRKPWNAESRARQAESLRLVWQNRSTEDRAEIGSRISAAQTQLSVVEDPDKKRCNSCKRVLFRGAFPKDPRNKDGLFGSCEECQNEKAKAWQARHLERVRGFRRARYGTDFNSLWVQQKGLCAVCGVAMLPRGKHPESVNIDHDHSCCPTLAKSCGKCVRGLVCHRCNLLLGQARDDRRVLEGALKYLDRWQTILSAEGGRGD